MYRVLIADDDESIRNAYSEMEVWKECGFEITVQSSNGKEALEALLSEGCDLLLTDICMPLMDGITLLREIRKRNIASEVVFVSEYDDFEYARQGLILGAFDYILKPVKTDKLRKVLLRAKGKLDEKKYAELSEPCVKAAFELCGMKCDTAFAQQLCSYFSEIGERVVPMEEAAAHFEITKDYFGKLFKQKFGIPYNHFYSVLRIEYAKALMRKYNYKTYEISEMLGYSSRDYFTKVFKQVTGKTPTEYKAEYFKAIPTESRLTD